MSLDSWARYKMSHVLTKRVYVNYHHYKWFYFSIIQTPVLSWFFYLGHKHSLWTSVCLTEQKCQQAAIYFIEQLEQKKKKMLGLGL